MVQCQDGSFTISLCLGSFQGNPLEEGWDWLFPDSNKAGGEGSLWSAEVGTEQQEIQNS